MVTHRRLADSPVGQKLTQEAKEFEFCQAVRLLQSALDIPQYKIPANQIRFKATNRQDFDPTIMQSVYERGDITEVTVNSLGILGQQGPMPSAHSIWLMNESSRGNRGPEEFINLFNHKFIAWRYLQDAQLSPMLFNQTPHEHWLYQCLAGINGLELSELLPRLPARKDDLAAFSGVLHGDQINQATLQQLLSVWLPFRSHIEQFQGGWKSLSKENQTRLSSSSLSSQSRLNEGRGLGEKVWDCSCGVKFKFGPLNFKHITHFLPHSGYFTRLINLLSFLTGGRYKLHLQIEFKWRQVPLAKLKKWNTTTKETNGKAQTKKENDSAPGLILGLTSWLKSRETASAPQIPCLKYELEPQMASLNAKGVV